MKAYELAEKFLNSTALDRNNSDFVEKQFREYIANGGDINERDADGMSALDIAQATQHHSKRQKLTAPRLVEIIKSLGGE